MGPLTFARPGSLAWLVIADLRLSRRRFADLFRGLGPRGRIVLVIAVAAIVHAIALPIGMRVVAAGQPGGDAALLWGGVAGVLAFAMSWMTAQSLLNATRTLFVRSDLDLMLSAPLPPRRIAAARLASMAAENGAAAGVFLIPLANAAALAGEPRWLAVYPTLAASAVIAATLGMGLALLLFRWFGPTRTRTAAQVLATVIGAVVALSIQAAAVLPRDMRATVIEGVRQTAASAGQAGSDSVMWLPVRAAAGDPVALLVMVFLAGGLFALASRLLGDRFVAGALRAASSAQVVRSERRKGPLSFVGGTGRSIRRKEWRLLTRDPWILGQLFLQIIYTLPVALILWRSGVGNGSPIVAVTPSLVVVAAQVSGALAWIAISGEDAPEFMATAPVSRAAQDLGKLQVIGLAVAGLLALPLIALSFVTLPGTLAAGAFCLVAGASTVMINLWHPTEGRRRSFMRRHAQSKLVGMLEHALALLWAVTAVLALMGTWVAILPGLLAVVVVVLAWRWLAGGRLKPVIGRLIRRLLPARPLPGATSPTG